MPAPLTPIATASGARFSPTGAPSPAKQNPVEAAHDFEALLVTQLLREARTGSGWLSDGEDSSSDAVAEFAEEQLARALTQSGGLGLSRLIDSGLATASAAKSTTASPATSPRTSTATGATQAITPPGT